MISHRRNLATFLMATAALAPVLVGCTSGDDDVPGGGSGGGSGGGGDGQPTSGAPALTQSGGCGDAFFWAATAEGDLAVTVSVEARDRSGSEPTVVDFTVPDPAVTVELQVGTELVQAFCNDLLDQNHHVESEHAASEGSGRITLGPIAAPGPTCGVDGELHVEGLAFEDGTEIGTVDVRSDAIGCYAG
jgi:hypothetical protein